MNRKTYQSKSNQWPNNYGYNVNDVNTPWWKDENDPQWDYAFENTDSTGQNAQWGQYAYSKPLVPRSTTPDRFYLAYGMNTNASEMSMRCPNAKNLGKVTVHGYKLAFRTHCDVIQEDYATVDCVLWKISEDCEHHLDRLEGFPAYYDKKTIKVTHEGREIDAMIYFMTNTEWSHGLALPTQHYLDCVLEGYFENDVSLNQVRQALKDVSEDLTKYENVAGVLEGYATRYRSSKVSVPPTSKDRYRVKSRYGY